MLRVILCKIILIETLGGVYGGIMIRIKINFMLIVGLY